MKKIDKRMSILIIIIACTIIISFIIYTYKNKYNNKKSIIEPFCKIYEVNDQGGLNDRRIELNYAPQSNIITSSCDQYWKDWPLEFNNELAVDEPIVINSDQLELPKERLFGNNMYNSGLIDFKKFGVILSDEIDYDIFEKTSELLIDPLTNESVEYRYNANYRIIILNRKSYVNRWYNYDPSIKKTFNYDEIKSPIETINKLNIEFKNRLDKRQDKILDNSQLILYGMIPFDIFKYKIINVKYLNSDPKKPVYVIQISLFREQDLYLNTFAYVGFINDTGNIIITEVKYIGRNSTDSVLLAKFYDPTDIHQEIINRNFTNTSTIDKSPDAIASSVKEHQEAFKLKNQYACFDINYDPNSKSEVLLPYFSRESCESNVDPYGRSKSVGIYDTPCKKNEDCPFYGINQNYENDFGKCLDNGQCELPINMIPLGFKYYKGNPQNKPLCYNCNSDKFKVFTELDSCCEDQYDKKKYPYLKSPDFAFDNDFQDRKNYFNNKYCKVKPGSLNIECDSIIL
jgi:hypothetical protein